MANGRRRSRFLQSRGFHDAKKMTFRGKSVNAVSGAQSTICSDIRNQERVIKLQSVYFHVALLRLTEPRSIEISPWLCSIPRTAHTPLSMPPHRRAQIG